MSPELAVALAAAAALEADGVRYLVGGSLASSQAGEPRSTPDIDLVAELDARSASALAKRLDRGYLWVPAKDNGVADLLAQCLADASAE